MALNENVQVELIEDKGERKIVLAEVVKQKTAKGKVLSVGEGRLLANGTWVKPQVAVGDTILYNPHLLQVVDHAGEKIYIINAQAIYGKFQ